MTDLIIKLCSTSIFHFNFLRFNKTEALISGLRFLGSYEFKLSSYIEDQSWTNKRKKLSVGLIRKKKSISAKLGTLNWWLGGINGTVMWRGIDQIHIFNKTRLTNVDHPRAIEIYQNWFEYIRTGSIFVISLRYIGLKWPSSQINELEMFKRLE